MLRKIISVSLALVMVCGGVSVSASASKGVNVTQAQTTTQKKVIKKNIRYTKAQLQTLCSAIKKISSDYPEIDTCFIDNKQNRVVVYVIGKPSTALKNKVKTMKNNGAVLFEEIAVEVDILYGDDNDEPHEDVIDDSEYYLSMTADTAADAANIMANYLRSALKPTDYTYLNDYVMVTVPENEKAACIDICVPSAKAMERVMDEVEKYREAKGIKYMDYRHPEKFVNVQYTLCKYSRSELYDAQTAILKDSLIKKNMKNGNIYSVVIANTDVRIMYNNKTKEMENWRSKNKYADMIVFEKVVKRNPQ